MNPRLKNESTTFPPGGLQFNEPLLGWNNTRNDPSTVWSWDGLVNAIYNLRTANAARFPKLSRDRNEIRRQISEQNARRISAMPGTESYLLNMNPVTTGGAANPTMPPPNAPSPQSAVGKLSAIVKGAASLLDWYVKDHGEPVARELSERRAAICVECPKNNMEDLKAWFTPSTAEFIRTRLFSRKELKLETSQDDKLGVCEACRCVMKLAVHEPLEIKLKHTTPEMKAQLWSACWQLQEQGES